MFEIGSMFVLGVTAGLHCIGMCGPIVLTLQAPMMRERRWAGNLAYNLGRVTTYVVVGTLLFLITSKAAESLPIENAKKGITLFVGFFLIALGIWLLLPFRLPDLLSPQKLPGFAAISRAAHERGRPGPVYLLGLVLGLLPCGMTYALYLRALDSPNVATAATMCLAFGLGTLPWLLLAGVFSNYLMGGLRKWGEIISGLIMIGLGAERIYRALTIVAAGHCH